MSENHTLMLSLTIYKIVTIFAGLAFAFMGYKLFVHGIFAEAGELRTNWENKSLILKKAAPGTFFALFGTVILCVSLWRGLTLEPAPEQNVFGGSGLFSTVTPKRENPNWQKPDFEETRPTVLDDIAILNQFADDLLRQQAQGKGRSLSVSLQEGDRVLDLIDRAKAALMLSVWSRDWGDPEEFRKWAQHTSDYAYSDPPTAIARAAAIYKGEKQ